MREGRRGSMALACFSAWVALAIVTLCLIVPDAMEMIWSGPSAAAARGQKQRQSSVASRVPPSFFNFVEAKRNGVDGVQGLGRAWAVVVLALRGRTCMLQASRIVR